ncbi:MAG: type IV toxin-antitoxin system AbiEi family antitoxin [Azonexus sp.]|jgi:predicted transcriptional regulator of viral defense system|uniref:type IV toxin-antitoxin system AbiEi family antitoxin domain-containing protein n=1 Tax=Azonexus sp. TaxID=1872668 RepID=UPI00282DCF65|nr:type IV toxin-antitoxin system AbiEi family antitoxin [Azonexus sp.]MDR0777476.1 type IV toxin-antitoxin system AbiEi family antitoxin [Azonexus sp.]
MAALEQYMEARLAQGRAYFLRDDVLAALGSSPEALNMALLRQARKDRLASPRQGFYLILRPEDRAAGAPDPARWIDPLMKYLQADYRIALLRAAAFHGASHQAAMVFQLIVPKQMRGVEIGRHRLEFIYQNPTAFAQVNQPEALASLKSDAGFAKVAGIELTLLDSARYFHKVGGINALAQIVKDLGGRARSAKLARLATHYENSAVRRLGYLLEHTHHTPQADALLPFVKKTKTAALLNPAVKPLIEGLPGLHEPEPRWRLILNEPMEIDF